MPPLTRWLTVLLLVLAGVTGTSSAAPAAPAAGVVTNCTQGGLNTALAGGGLVTFNCGGPTTIVFSGATTLTTSAIIDGGGVITLTGNLATRLFNVPSGLSLTLRRLVLDRADSGHSDGGAIANHGRLTLENSTIQASLALSPNNGGAIFTDGPLTLTNSLLTGNSAGSGGALYASTAGARVTINNSRLNDNHAVASLTGVGGAIWVGTPAQLTLTAGQVNSNTAALGGGLYISLGGALTLTSPSRVQLAGNTASADGGALFVENGASARLTGADLSGNHATSGLGGAVASRGALTVDDSLFRLNQAGTGGGLATGVPMSMKSLAPSPTNILHSAFVSNTASNEGGGVYVQNSTTVITVTDTSFDGNQSGEGGGGLARYEAFLLVARSSFTHNHGNAGGGLFVTYDTNAGAGGYVTVRDSTLSGNTAVISGGAVLNQDLLQLINVTLKDNSSGFDNLDSSEVNGRLRGSVLQNTGPNCEGAAPSDDSSNYATDLTCAFNTVSSHQGTLLNPQLGPLARDPNGFTDYYLPLAASPLIDHGPGTCAAQDQRGIPRVGACDIGAVEFGGLLARLWLPLLRR